MGGPVDGGGAGIGAHSASVPKNKLAGILMTSFAAFGGILYGYDTGVIAGVKEMPNWLDIYGDVQTGNALRPLALSSGRESLIVSILSAGTFVGALCASFTSDALGRRLGICFGCALFCAGVAMQTAASSQVGDPLALFVVGRVFAGLGVGMTSVIVPMYQSECAPKWIRGTVVSAYQWAITIGLLLASIVNNATKDRPDFSSWRIPIAIQFVWAAVLVSGMLYLPESPRWLIKKGRDAQAANALGRLTSLPPTDPIVELELDDVRTNLRAELAMAGSSYLDCFRNGTSKIRLRVLTGIALQGLQQLTGINFIFYYGTTFFQNSGVGNAFIISIITNVVNVVMTLPGMWGVERFGRRRLLLVGAAGMCFCEFLIAIIGVTISVNNAAGQGVLIAFVCIYIAFFASTWGPIAWVITGELFPLAIRAKAMSLAVASNWLWNFGIGYATPYMVNDTPGSAGLKANVFWIWGSMCALCFVFTYFFIPETKGLSLEQIDMMYQSTTPRLSHEYRRQLVAGGDHGALDAAQQQKMHGQSEFKEVA